MSAPILQFGTGRFLQAHVDLFVSQALAAGEAIGGIVVVQTTDSAQSSRRLAALARGEGFRVEVRGLRDGFPVDEVVQVRSVQAAWNATRDWAQVRDSFVHDARVVVSNTADQGYALAAQDDAPALIQGAVNDPAWVPASFPAKLLVLLHWRWLGNAAAPLTLYPCELVSRNGDTLRDIVLGLVRTWQLPVAFADYVATHCVWVNSLVDRIVSSPLEPAGAVAEPYALWAIERRDGMLLPCRHPAIVVTDALARYERLKLLLLNLGHSYLAECWQVAQRRHDETVLEAMQDGELRDRLESVWNEEVLPVFDAQGDGDAARDYLVQVRDRLLNPFLEHRLADIAQNHAQKKQRRFAPVIAEAERLRIGVPQTQLRTALQRA
jgi:tagaturonate reductase